MYGSRGRSRGSLWIPGAIGVGAVCVALSATVGQAMDSPVAAGLAAAMLGTVASTGAMRWWWGRSRTAVLTTRPRRRMLLVGTGPMAEHLTNVAEREDWDVVPFVEYLQSASEVEWSSRKQLPDLVRDLGIDRVLVAEGPGLTWELVEQIDREDAPVGVFVVPDAYELALGRPGHTRMGDVALLRLSRGRGRRGYQMAKRVFDVACTVLLLLIFGPVLALAIAAIRLNSPGPALFRQERVGKDGRRFDVIKLRTMVADAEKDGPRFCEGKRDPRLTPVGSFLRRTHLDELPQLWNVLRGEMSLVGPRPERPVFVEQFEQELPRYNERHRILPGITGLAQVNGYYHSSPREKLRFDLMYLYHRNLWLDVCILARTLLQVVK